MKTLSIKRTKSQRGVSTLTITLLLMVVLLIPAMTSLRRTQANEQMVASSIDRARTFQQAEAALLEGEAFAKTKPTLPSSGCSGGICVKPTSSPPWISNTNFWSGTGPATAQAGQSVTSKYAVEFLGLSTGETDDCTTGGDVSPDAQCDRETSRYRVTVFSQSETGSEVMLQSNVLVP